MNYADIKTFFKTICTENGWGFAHNYEHLEERCEHERSWKGKLILTMDEPHGSLSRSGNWRDDQSHAFWLLKSVAKSDWEAEDTTYEQAKAALKTIIIPAMQEQIESESGIWQHLTDHIEYAKVGPVGKARQFGIHVSLGTIDYE